MRCAAAAAGVGLMTALLSHHWTDDAVDGRERRRTIENWRNYRTPAGLWLAANVDVAERSAAPPDWQGAYDFTHAQLGSALQAFVGGSTDPSNTALWGMRSSERPGAWLNFKALGIDNVSQPAVDRAARTATWVELWNNCDLRLTLGRHKVAKDIVLKAAPHQASFRFALRYPAGYSHTVTDSVLRILDDQGVEVFRSRPPHGTDSAGNPVRVSLVAAADITIGPRTFPTVRVVPSATDLASAQYPVTIDPTTTISGTTDIEDATIRSANSLNYGATTTLFVMSSPRHVLMRCATAAIPAGTLTAARLKAYAKYSASAATATIYRVAQANSAWVEGTANGAAQTGSCCWNNLAYDGTTPTNWAGSAGLQTATTDYDTANTATLVATSAIAQWETATLTTAWFTAWRDATWANAGMVLKLTTGTQLDCPSTENASNQPYFEIDYTAAAGGIPALMAYYRQRRRS